MAVDDVAFAPELPNVERSVVVTLQEFAAVEEPGTDPLVGDPDNILIGQGTDATIYGDGGAGKTTLTVDLACHLAAGDDWLGLSIPGPARVLLIENEGPRSLFRAKLRRKLANWQGSPLEDRLLVWDEPWASFTFAEERERADLAVVIRDRDLDVVIIGPATAAGMEEAGTIQDVRAFAALLADVRTVSGRRVSFVLVHHENKAGKVSGAWEGVGDTMLHVLGQGHGRTRVDIEKARWASAQHGTTMQLLWADGDGFTLEEKSEVDDETIADAIRTYVREHAGTGWGNVRKTIKGIGNDRIDAVRSGLFAARELVNVQKVDGVETATYEVRERRSARLFLADDPAVTHLCQASGTAPAQSVPLCGAGQ